MGGEEPTRASVPEQPDRRGFLARATSVAMSGGLLLAYGTFGAMAARFLYPSRPREVRWQFVATLDALRPGESLSYRSPIGETVTVARQGEGRTAEDFVALSSTCPHLGCQVHYEPQNTRFFCPCHNGVFDPTGKATAGPPADAGQSLLRFPLKVEGNLLFVRVPLERLATLGERG
jgi:cytochrome b6-f complex iron-sulfur subunit